jgi:phosphatidylinositol-4,5-bisphosphate 3-kinase
MPQQITVDCLLPNGVIIPLRCYRHVILETIKKDLWREARNYPLSHLLKTPSSYIFVSITQVSQK